MNVLITGGTGFIGTKLANKLIDSNKVTVVDHRLGKQSQIQYINADYSSKQVFNNLSNTDSVYHLAWSGTPASKHSWDSQQELNIKPSLTLASQAKQSGVKHFFFLSSAGPIYGNIDTPYVETQTPQPTNDYGRAKLAVEKELTNLSDSNFKVTILRATNVVHPDQHFKNNQGLIPAIIKGIKSKTPFELWGNSQKDYIALEDLITAIIKIKSKQDYTLVNIGSGQSFNTKQIINLAEQVSGNNLNVIEIPSAKHDTQAVEVDLTKLNQLSQWLPDTDMETYITNVFKTHLLHE